MGQVTTCLHRWVDGTTLGSLSIELRCAWCGEKVLCRRDRVRVRKSLWGWVIVCPCCSWWGVCANFDFAQALARKHALTRHAW